MSFLRILVVAMVVVVGISRAAIADGFALVGNAKAAPHTLAKADVRALYTGRMKTLAGNPVQIVVRADDDASFGQFADSVFGISAKTLLSKIKQEVFKGEMPKPIKSGSDDDVLQAVGANTGTIGVISAGAAGHLPKTITVIAIGG